MYIIENLNTWHSTHIIKKYSHYQQQYLNITTILIFLPSESYQWITVPWIGFPIRLKHLMVLEFIDACLLFYFFPFLAMQSVDIPSKCIRFKCSHEGSNNTQENHMSSLWNKLRYIQIYSKSRWDLRIHVINVIITSFVTKRCLTHDFSICYELRH